jgi:hypothetical protein
MESQYDLAVNPVNVHLQADPDCIATRITERAARPRVLLQ